MAIFVVTVVGDGVAVFVFANAVMGELGVVFGVVFAGAVAIAVGGFATLGILLGVAVSRVSDPKAQARKLKAEGVKPVEIARRLGISADTAHSWTRNVPWPPRECYVCGRTFSPRNGNQKTCCGENARKRWHEDQRRARCIDCGAALRMGSGYPADQTKRCAACARSRKRAAIEPRRRQVEEWWAQGLKMREIAELLGWSMNHFRAEFGRMRRAGYSLPHRHRGYGEEVA